MKTINSKNKKLLSNAILVFLIVALPLFVWAVLTQRLDLRKRASSGEPLPSVCIPENNQVVVTPYGSDGTCHDIQTAINAVTGDGYTVFISPGVYNVNQTIDVHSKSNITITGNSEFGSNATTINFNDNSWGFLIQSTSGRLEWLKIQGGSANGMLSIKNSVNFSVGYSSVYSQSSHTMDIQNSTNISVYNTEIQSSAGALEIENSHGVTVSNSNIHNSNTGIFITGSSAKIFSNAIYENREEGIVLNKPVSVEIYSNTIVDNNAAGLQIIYVEPIYETIVNVYKNILARNGSGIDADSSFSSIDSFSFNFNDVWGNDTDYIGVSNRTGISGNISSDPLFGESYCVNEGSPVLYGLVSNGEYMGVRLYCDGILPSPTPPPTACPNVPFTLEVTPSTQTGSLGQTLRYDVRVTNNDSTCGPLGTNLIVDKPSNWIANFGTQNFTLAYNHTYSTYLDVTSPTSNYFIGEQPITVRVVTVNAGNTNSATVTYNLTYPASPSPSASPASKIGDVNNDNRVNLVDIGILIDEFDRTNPTNPRADINGDGRVGLIDIGIVIDRYEW